MQQTTTTTTTTKDGGSPLWKDRRIRTRPKPSTKQQRESLSEECGGGAKSESSSSGSRPRYFRKSRTMNIHVDENNNQCPPPRKRTLRRSASDDDGSRVGLGRRQSLKKRIDESRRNLTGNHMDYAYASDHAGGKYDDSYTFWSSRPALLMFASLVLAITFQNINLAGGALLVFLYQLGVVFSKWGNFIIHHPMLVECLELTSWWYHFSRHQAERFLDEKDRTRKAAVGLFVMNFNMTKSVVGGYFEQRRHEMTQKTKKDYARISTNFQAAAEARKLLDESGED